MLMIMKKFTLMKEIKTEKYANGDFLRNDLLKIIEENLTINNEDGDLGILGKDDLVNKFVEVLSEKLIKMEISLLESISKNPAILKEYNSNPVDKKLLSLNEKVNQILMESEHEDEYEEYLNTSNEGVDLTDGEYTYMERTTHAKQLLSSGKLGTAMREFDPTQFKVGLGEWERENGKF